VRGERRQANHVIVLQRPRNTVTRKTPSASPDVNLFWDVRAFVYKHFAATAQPPSVNETAAHFDFGADEAIAIYQELNRRHAFFLEPGTLSIRIANPFSAVPTSFRVHAQGRSYWANCAWDALGIPAALHCDAIVEATYAGSEQPVTLTIRDGQVETVDAVAHFLVPFDRWYDDMVFT